MKDSRTAAACIAATAAIIGVALVPASQAAEPAAAAKATGPALVVWTCSPYIATGPASMPPAKAAPAKLTIAAAQNETEHVVINITNFTGKAVELRLAAGLKHEEFALQSIDEANGCGVQQVIDTTPLIREADPKLRLAMTIMTGLDELKKMAPHVDVWLNRNGAIWGDEQAAFFASERARGKPIWSWNMPCTPKSKPITDFRTYGWRAMKFDFDAIGFFLYFGLVYVPQRPGGGIATRHWEAWRDGVEDYQLLRVLRDEIERAGKRGAGEGAIGAARSVLARAVDEVITDKFFPPNTQETHDRIQAARAKVAAEIGRVRKLGR